MWNNNIVTRAEFPHLSEIEREYERFRASFDDFDVKDFSPNKNSGSWYNFAKRAVDIAVVLLIAPSAGIVLIAAVLAIWASMGRPVMFAQERVGLNGRIFKMFKLRTMRPSDHKI